MERGRDLLEKATARPWFWPYDNLLAGGAGGDIDGDWCVIAAVHDAQLPTEHDRALIVWLANNAERLLEIEAALRAYVETLNGGPDDGMRWFAVEKALSIPEAV